MNKEKPLSLEQIDNNVNELKGKLGRDSSPFYCHLYSSVSNMDITKLDWKNPLASQVISNESELVNQLSGNLKKGFMVNFLSCKLELVHNHKAVIN